MTESKKRTMAKGVMVILIETVIVRLLPDAWGLDGSVRFGAGMIVGALIYGPGWR